MASWRAFLFALLYTFALRPGRVLQARQFGYIGIGFQVRVLLAPVWLGWLRVSRGWPRRLASLRMFLLTMPGSLPVALHSCNDAQSSMGGMKSVWRVSVRAVITYTAGFCFLICFLVRH